MGPRLNLTVLAHGSGRWDQKPWPGAVCARPARCGPPGGEGRPQQGDLWLREDGPPGRGAQCLQSDGKWWPVWCPQPPGTCSGEGGARLFLEVYFGRVRSQWLCVTAE